MSEDNDEGEWYVQGVRVRVRIWFRFNCKVKIGLRFELGFVFSVRFQVMFRIWVMVRYG